jgi:hypothetical protein
MRMMSPSVALRKKHSSLGKEAQLDWQALYMAI